MRHSFAPALILGFLAASIPISASCAVVSGTVRVTRSGCDYFIVGTKNGYDLLEWYGGWTPDKGDTLTGTFEEYGFHSIYDRTAGRSVRVYVEEYWLDFDDAFDQLNDHCD